MWLIIWAIFVAFVLVFVGWTTLVLFQQKRAWAGFAKKHKMRYISGKLMESPAITGSFDDKQLSLYTGVQQTEDIRGQRFVTVIEFQIGADLPTGAALSTKEFAGFINTLAFGETYKPESSKWQADFVLQTRYAKNLQAYLTEDRLNILTGLFSMKNAAVLLFFDEIEAVLRVESSDPLRDIAHMEKIVKRLSKAAETLAASAEEKKTFKLLLKQERLREIGDSESVDEIEEIIEKSEAKKEEEEQKEKGTSEDDSSS